MRKIFILSSLLAFSFANHAFADDGFLKIISSNQGLLKGDYTGKGREDFHSVVDFEYSTGSAPISIDGTSSGRRVRPPASFTLKLSKGTPLLINAALRKELISEISYLNYSAPINNSGAQILTDTIKFENVSIESVTIFDKNGNENKVDPLVKITITYEKAIITNIGSPKSGEENRDKN